MGRSAKLRSQRKQGRVAIASSLIQAEALKKAEKFLPDFGQAIYGAIPEIETEISVTQFEEEESATYPADGTWLCRWGEYGGGGALQDCLDLVINLAASEQLAEIDGYNPYLPESEAIEAKTAKRLEYLVRSRCLIFGEASGEDWGIEFVG